MHTRFTYRKIFWPLAHDSQVVHPHALGREACIPSDVSRWTGNEACLAALLEVLVEPQ